MTLMPKTIKGCWYESDTTKITK